MKLAAHVVAMLLACFSDAVAQTPFINNVVSQASSAAPLAPGMPITVNGTNFATGNASCPGPKVPFSCGSVTVTVNGAAVPIRYAFPGQIITYIPSDQPRGQVTIVVKNSAGLISNAYSVAVEQYAPGIQMLSDAGQLFGYFSDRAQRAITRFNPAVAGQELTLYAVGLGPTNPVVPTGEIGNAPAVSLPTLWMGNRPVPVLFSGLGCGALCDPGNFLVRFILPADTPPGDQNVYLQIGGKQSNTGTLVVGLPAAAPSVGYVQSLFDARVRTLSPGAMAAVVGGGFLPGPGGIGQCSIDPSVWPTKCQGLTVDVNGRAAAIQVIGPNFINIQIPFEVSPGPATLSVERTADSQTLKSNTLNFTLDAYSPTLVTNPQSPYAGVVITNTGGPASPTNPVMPGDIIYIHMTGLGQTNPPMVTGFSLLQPARTLLTPTVTIGGKQLENIVAEVLPQMIGQYRITARVPTGLGVGDLPISVEIGGKKSQDGLLVPVANQPVIGAVASSASGLPEIAPGSWVSLYGRNLSPNRRDWTEADIVYDWLPTILDGVEVSFNDTSAVVSFISPTQLNVLAPDNLPRGPVDVTVKSSLGWQKSTVMVKQYAPGLFPLSIPPGNYLVALHSDWSYVARPGLLPPNVASRPAQPGETIVFYGTGFGPTNPPVSNRQRFSGSVPLPEAALLRVQIGSVQAQVGYAGLIGNGLYQLNVVVPNLPDGEHEVIVSLGSEASPRGKIISVRR